LGSGGGSPLHNLNGAGDYTAARTRAPNLHPLRWRTHAAAGSTGAPDSRGKTHRKHCIPSLRPELYVAAMCADDFANKSGKGVSGGTGADVAKCSHLSRVRRFSHSISQFATARIAVSGVGSSLGIEVLFAPTTVATALRGG